MINKHKQNKIRYKSSLYNIVFGNVYVKGTVFFIFLSFFIQPIAPVFAAETQPENEVPVEPVSEAKPPEPAQVAVPKPTAESVPEVVKDIAPAEPKKDVPVTITSEAGTTEASINSEVASVSENNVSETDINTTTELSEQLPETDTLVDSGEELPDEVSINNDTSESIPPEQSATVQATASTTEQVNLATSSLPNDIVPNDPVLNPAVLGESTTTNTIDQATSSNEITTDENNVFSNQQNSTTTATSVIPVILDSASTTTSSTTSSSTPTSSNSNSTNTADTVNNANTNPENNLMKSTDTSTTSTSNTASTSPAEVISETELTSSTTQPTLTNSVEENSTSTPPVINVATSTENINMVDTVINNENKYQFGVGQCTTVGDGSYYCSDANATTEMPEDGVFAVPDKDGDMEIMVRVSGKESFITSNNVDDSAPYYDAVSNRIVWHTLINDRYQIAVYDFATGKTKMITNENYNNMEPVAYGNLILWQAWLKNNWEIMMYDGSTTTQLTDNDVHDVAPSMQGGYVMWQTQFADGWQAAVYDLKTKQVNYIGKTDGSQIENPRFVLVYDAMSANGDVQTMGYDLDNKKLVPLSKTPNKLPKKLPKPSGNTETVAFVQNNKSSTRSSDVVWSTPTKSSGGAEPKVDPVINSVSSSTLDMTASTTKITATSSPITTVPDLEIPALPATSTSPNIDSQELSTTTATSSIAHISDLIITPQATTTNAETL